MNATTRQHPKEAIITNEASSPWYVSFFGDDYLDAYGHLLTEERAQREVAFVEDALGLVPSSSVLDLCCGTGRHAVLLAKRGFQVTAQDLSESYLARASRAAEAAGVGLSVAHSDMRSIPFEASFDAVINMFTAFGYLESEEEGNCQGPETRRALSARPSQQGMGRLQLRPERVAPR